MDLVHANLLSFAFVVIGWVGIFLVSIRRSRAQGKPVTAKRDVRSILGILVQGLGIAVAFWGPAHLAPSLLERSALLAAAFVGVIVAVSLLLFRSALKALGQNWSVVAEVREGGDLVTTGPFAYVRNPVYLAMLLLTIATALSLGHLINLIMAVPLYLAGTELRILAEEGLLRERFGAEFDGYAKRVRRIIPFIW
jgi:protein-S-isoprenylcysteine O-methyltransferase Ste14